MPSLKFKPSGDKMLVAIVVFSLAILALTGCSDAKIFPQVTSPPNIIFVFSDQHRYHSMSISEMPMLQTPTMARMAKEGFHFRQCISNYPVCTPYRAMVMTGRWPFDTGITDNDLNLDDTIPTIADTFKSAGYTTGYVGKWHLGGTNPDAYGFDNFQVWQNTNVHYDEAFYYTSEGKEEKPKGYNATLMTDQALKFIAQNKGAPFFLMLSLNPPHSVYTDAPPEKKALYPDGSLPLRPNFQKEPRNPLDAIFFPTGSPYYEGYHAHISAVDDELARIFDTLKTLHLTENTMVVYTSDHGDMQGSHGMLGKRLPYEESIRVPFLLWGPGHINAGKETDSLLGTIDIMPTLLGLAGIPVPPDCAGRDISGLTHGEELPHAKSQFIMHVATVAQEAETPKVVMPLFRGVRTPQYTYAIEADGSLRLFDNIRDPYQMTNIADDPAYAQAREECKQQLSDWLKAANDPFVIPMAKKPR